MERSFLHWSISTERRRDALITLLWGATLGSIFSEALFQRTTATLLETGVMTAICLVAGIVISDLGKALFSYIAAMIIGLTIPFALAIIPALNGTIPPPGDSFYIALWFSILFKMVFPVQIGLFFAASIIGAIVGEIKL